MLEYHLSKHGDVYHISCNLCGAHMLNDRGSNAIASKKEALQAIQHHLVVRHGARAREVLDEPIERGQRQAIIHTWNVPEEAVASQVRCVKCGQLANHSHGVHGCCGSMFCHTSIAGSHMVSGESGLLNGDVIPRFEW